jgi:hypothetical protein
MKEQAMRLIVIALLATGLLAGRAAAQPAPWAPERLTPGWTVLPGIVFGALWDSNVTVQGQGTPEIAEWVGVVNPRGEIVYNGRLTRFSAGYSGSLERYRELRALDRFEQRGKAELTHRATPRLQFGAGFSMARTPTTDRLEVNGLPFVDVGSHTRDLTAQATYALGRRTSLEGGYHFQEVDFDRDDLEGNPLQAAILSGGYAHSPSLSVRHEFNSRFSAGSTLEHRKATVGNGLDHFTIQNATGDIRYRLNGNTSLSASGGVSHLYLRQTNVDRWGPRIRASLEHAAGLTQVTLRYERAFIPSFSFGGLTGNQFLSLSATTPLTRGGRWTTTGSASYGRTEPLDEIGFAIQRDSYWFNGSLGYQIARWLRADGFVTSAHQRTDALGNVNRLRAGIQFSTSKPVRIQ